MSDKQLFQEVLSGIRSDLTYVKSVLFQTLIKIIADKDYYIDEEVKVWIFDVFLDKVYEINSKIVLILADFGVREPELSANEIKLYTERLAFDNGEPAVKADLNFLYGAIETYERIVEDLMTTLRQVMHEKNWEPMKKVVLAKYVLPIKRAKYVKAREELEKAKHAVNSQEWDEVLNHLRPAIDLALKEKFGFSKIHPMKQFLIDAEKYNLSLPSYTMVYDYFDEGSQRIHSGKLNTPWECEEALSFVAGFIDRLDLIIISEAEINEFKNRSKTVE